MFKLTIAAALAAATLSLASGADARTRYAPEYDYGYAPEGVQPGLRTADGRACVKQCPNDSLPCDPPSFKQADGRCTTMWH